MLKKNTSRILFIFILIISFIAVFGRSLDLGDISFHGIESSSPKYDIEASFYPDEQKLVCNQTVIIKNNSDDDYRELFFHLYPNAYKSIDSTPFQKSQMSLAYPEGFLPGYITVHNVSKDGVSLNYEITDTILEVQLQEPLKPGKGITVDMEFTDILPPSQGRYGYGDNTFNIANWYPILAVRDEEGWNKDPYYAIGDPFYSDVGKYRVSIRAPKEFTIASTGSMVEQKKLEDFEQWVFTTDLVRDFAWVASHKFEQASKMVGDTRVTSFFIKGDDEYGKRALDIAAKALEFFNEYFGKYPYEDYAVVASDFFIGGMEYPNLVMIGQEFYSDNDFLEYVIVHETAHQWWYGLVGNNQIKEPWLDEALTEYSTVIYYENMYGPRVGREIYEKFIVNPYNSYEISYRPGKILRSLDQFDNWEEYNAMVYSKGAMMMKNLEGKIGVDTFRDALRYYYRENMYKNATAQDFIKAINRAAGADWSGYIYDWLIKEEPLQEAA